MKQLLLSLLVVISLLPAPIYGATLTTCVSNSVEGQTTNPNPDGTCPQGYSGGITGYNSNLSYVPLEPLPGVNYAPIGSSGVVNLTTLLKAYFNIAITLGGFIAIVLLIIGGITYMFSDVSHVIDGAKRRIRAALWGLLLLLSSVLILNTINPQLITLPSALTSPLPGSSPVTPNLTANQNPPPTQAQIDACAAKGTPVECYINPQPNDPYHCTC